MTRKNFLFGLILSSVSLGRALVVMSRENPVDPHSTPPTDRSVFGQIVLSMPVDPILQQEVCGSSPTCNITDVETVPTGTEAMLQLIKIHSPQSDLFDVWCVLKKQEKILKKQLLVRDDGDIFCGRVEGIFSTTKLTPVPLLCAYGGRLEKTSLTTFISRRIR